MRVPELPVGLSGSQTPVPATVQLQTFRLSCFSHCPSPEATPSVNCVHPIPRLGVLLTSPNRKCPLSPPNSPSSFSLIPPSDTELLLFPCLLSTSTVPSTLPYTQ